MLGRIKDISEVFNITYSGRSALNGKNGSQMGMNQMIGFLLGSSSVDGYKVSTDKHVFYVLIDNGQSCCEDWGYFSSEDDITQFIGAELLETKITDVALNSEVLDKTVPYIGDGGVQFVDFVTSKGTLQLAVYNAHNGYYGHGIYFLKDEDVLLNDTL